MTKATKKSAGYTEASAKGKNCGTCKSMRDDGSCAKVQGQVDRRHVCRLWSPKASSVSGRGGQTRRNP